MIKYFITDNGQLPPSAMVRIDEDGNTERVTRNATSWEPYPRLQKLAFEGLNMAWDEITEAQARTALSTLGVAPALIDN